MGCEYFYKHCQFFIVFLRKISFIYVINCNGNYGIVRHILYGFMSESQVFVFILLMEYQDEVECFKFVFYDFYN